MSLFVLAISIIMFSACGNSKPLSEEDLERININVEHPNAEDHLFQLTLAGFEDTESPLYKSALSMLRNTRTGDITNIIEVSADGHTGEKSPEIRAFISQPISLNRTLWAFGKNHYRAHHVEYESDHTGNKFYIMDRMPELIGGLDGLQQNIRYPAALEESNIEGEVVLELIVNEYGEAENVAVVSSLHEAANREAIRAVKEASFHPGEYDGLPVRVMIALSVLFNRS